MWIMASQTVIASRGFVRFDFGNVRRLVTFKAHRGTRFDEESFVVGRVRSMAAHTVAIFDRSVFELGSLEKIVVAIEAGSRKRFFQQALDVRGMRTMAIKAIAGLNRLMLDLACCQRIVVTFQAHGFACSEQQFFVRGFVGIVAGRTIASFSRLMSKLDLGKKVVVARKTDRVHWSLHFFRKFRFVALSAVAVVIWRMKGVLNERFCHRNNRGGICIGWQSFISRGDRWSMGSFRSRHAVKKAA